MLHNDPRELQATSPVRPVTSLGLYSNQQLDDRPRLLPTSAKSIQGFQVGPARPSGDNGEEDEDGGKGNQLLGDQEVLRSNIDSLEIQQKPCLHPSIRQHSILLNKQKSNLQYLQTQTRELYNLHYNLYLQQQLKQAHTRVLQAESSIRRLKLQVNEQKGRRSRVQENHHRLDMLRGLLLSQAKVSNRLNLKELELDEEAGWGIVEERSEGDEVESREEGYSRERIGRHSRKEAMKLTDISDNTGSQLLKLKDEATDNPTDISAILNNSAYMPKPIVIPQPPPLLSRSQQEYRKILLDRISIIRQSIASTTREYRNRVDLLNREKFCLRKSIELFKLNIIETENERRRLSKALLRQKSQSLFRSRFRNLANLSNSQSKYRYRLSNPGLMTTKYGDMSPRSKLSTQGNSLYYDAWREYQMSARGLCQASRQQRPDKIVSQQSNLHNEYSNQPA